MPSTSVFYMVEKFMIYGLVRINSGKHVCYFVMGPFYVFYVEGYVVGGYNKPNISQSQC